MRGGTPTLILRAALQSSICLRDRDKVRLMKVVGWLPSTLSVDAVHTSSWDL